MLLCIYYGIINLVSYVNTLCMCLGEAGYYCIGGVKYPCPPGTYGGRIGLNSSICNGPCMRGHYCPSCLTPESFPDAPVSTVWPLKPHIRANDYKCGDVTLYCPLGSIYPLSVDGGYYTGGGDNKLNTTRYYRIVCPVGSYCVGGVPYLCPRGTYGNTTGLMLPGM